MKDTNTKAEFLLVGEGEALCKIVTPSVRSSPLEFAAGELARHVKTITGATLPIVTETGEPGIFLRQQDYPTDSSPSPNSSALSADGYGMAIRDGNLHLTGADERGILYAVYDLLHRFGCRWPAPDFAFYGGADEHVPKSRSLRVLLPNDFQAGPRLKYRKFYVEEGHSHNLENLRQLVDWMPKLRLNTLVIPINYQGHGRVKWDNWRESLTPELERRGIWIEVGGHGYQNFLNAEMEGGRLFAEHPEWFGMDEEGNRDRNPHRVFCSSNHEAFEFLKRNVLRYLREHPEIDIFDFWPPDSARWCHCPHCIPLGDAGDRHAFLVSEVSKAARETRPDVRFECIAYHDYNAPPAHVRMDESVLVDFCPINQCFEFPIYDTASARNTEYKKNLQDWLDKFQGDISIYSYYRKYAWNSLPNLIPHYMQDDLRFYEKIGVRGVSSYAEPGDWGTYELNHYVLAHLAWNPDTDVDALIREFAGLRFGDSGCALAMETYGFLEEHTRRFSSIPFTSRKAPEAYAQALDRLRALTERVEASEKEAAGTLLEGAWRRLRLSLRYLALDMALLHAQVHETPTETRTAMRDKLLAFTESNGDAGVFIHRRIRAERLDRRYGINE